MKKLKYGIVFLAVIGIGIVSCEKEVEAGNVQTTAVENEVNYLNSSNEVIIEWNSNGGDNVWSSSNYRDEISWIRTNSSNQNFDATIFIGEMESDSVIIISKSSSSLSYSFDGQTYQMGNISVTGNIFEATVSGPNSIPVNLKISDFSGDFSSGFNNLAANDIIDIGFGDEQELACPWCIVWGAAALISSIVDASCSYIIQQDVAACTANGKCSVVHSCSATCIAC